jgi:hypothetical protein
MARINESLIPNSIDGVFIRGLKSNIEASAVKEYFNKNTGTCIVSWSKLKGENLLIALK